MRQNNQENCDAPEDPAKTDSLIEYVQVIARRSGMIFKVTLAAIVISIVYSLLLPNIYTARTLIVPALEDKNMMSAMMSQLGGLANLVGGSGVSLGGPSTLDLYVSMLNSEAVKDPVIDRLKLLSRYKRKFRADIYSILDRKVGVTSGKKDGIITVSVNDRDPKRAAEMANVYVEELGKLAVGLSITGAGQNRLFLEERLSKAKADLGKAEDNMKAFQSKNKAVHVSAQAEASIKGVADLRAQLAAQEVQLATFRRQLTDSSQEVKNLVTSVANLKAQITKLEGEGESSSIPSFGSIPTLEQEYVRLKRDLKIQESLVELLTKQYEMSKLSESKEVSPFQVIHYAKVPERKSKPARSKIVIAATILGFSVSLILAFLLERISRMPEPERLQWEALASDLNSRLKLDALKSNSFVTRTMGVIRRFTSRRKKNG